MFETVFVVGLGNIGSQVVPLLASVPGVKRVGLVDFDRYEAGNLGGQRLAPRDVGRAKARVQRRILHILGPHLAVTAHVCRFEALPPGSLRGSVILACVDSRSARQAINRAAVAHGVPWIDAALGREGSVRARFYLPGHACLECGWGPRDYELLEQRLPCQGAGVAPSPTNAPIELGAIAAGLQVALLRRLVSDPAGSDALADRQWLYDLPSGRGWVASYMADPACRLDHARWDVTALGVGSVDLALRDALALAGPPSAGASLAAPGMVFVRRLRCPRCGSKHRVHCRLSGRIGHRARCEACGVPRLAASLDVDAELSARNVSGAMLRQPLARRGFVAGDIVAVSAIGAVRHFQLA